MSAPVSRDKQRDAQTIEIVYAVAPSVAVVLLTAGALGLAGRLLGLRGRYGRTADGLLTWRQFVGQDTGRFEMTGQNAGLRMPGPLHRCPVRERKPDEQRTFRSHFVEARSVVDDRRAKNGLHDAVDGDLSGHGAENVLSAVALDEVHLLHPSADVE